MADLRLLTDRELGQILGVCPRTLSNWRSKLHNGPDFIKLSDGTIRYERKTVEAWLRSCTVSGEWTRRLKYRGPKVVT